MPEVWARGAAYEPYVGRWSRLVAVDFIRWLDPIPGRNWLDVGCGTGALTEHILATASPTGVTGIDSSKGYVEYSGGRITDPRAKFEVADAQSLPFESGSYDYALSGLVLNFVPTPDVMVNEMRRVIVPAGTVAAYVWDYAGDMQLMRYFWDAAVALNPDAKELDEGVRFQICQTERLERLFNDAGLHLVQTRAIDVPTVFRGFDDYWSPFLGGQAPAPAYCTSLSEDGRAELRERLRATLPIEADGSIRLIARAWAVRGTR